MTTTHSLTHDETILIDEALGKPDGVIAAPTDTVYGLICNIDHPLAVEKIYKIKKRDLAKPLILLGTNRAVFEKYVKYIPEELSRIMDKYWPGELTIVLPKSRHAPENITAGLETIGIRVPKHPILIEVLKRCCKDQVLASTSANISDQPDLTTYEQVKTILGDKVDYLVEDYNYPISGTPSTIIKLGKDNKIKILRQGSVVID